MTLVLDCYFSRGQINAIVTLKVMNKNVYYQPQHWSTDIEPSFDF